VLAHETGGLILVLLCVAQCSGEWYTEEDWFQQRTSCTVASPTHERACCHCIKCYEHPEEMAKC
jgi:hypothetical protein